MSSSRFLRFLAVAVALSVCVAAPLKPEDSIERRDAASAASGAPGRSRLQRGDLPDVLRARFDRLTAAAAAQV